jgi:hypothetical protein
MKYNIEELKKFIDEKLSFVEIGKRTGYSDVYVRKLLINLGLFIPRNIKRKNSKHLKPFKKCLHCNNSCINKNSKYCSKECESDFKKSKKYKDFLENNEKYCRANYSPTNTFKQQFLQEQDNKCDICKIPNEWNGKSLVFVLDHIDSNAANNKRENLRCICPNCDSQLDTYKSKNKNSARKERYLLNYKNTNN